MSQNLKLKVYRLVSGIRTPYFITLDASRLIVDERVDDVELAVLLKQTTMNPVQISQDDVDKITKLEQWMDVSTPNPIPGTEGLREEYASRLAKAQAADCTSCELNGLKQEFRALIERAGLL